MKLATFLAGALLAPFLVSTADGQTPVIANYAGCKEKTDMQRVLELVDEGDLAAAGELIQRGLKSKDCRILAGEDVVVESFPPFTRLVKVRVRGNPDSYWIID